MIVFNDVVKKFNNNVVLDHVSGEFIDGKVNMVIGLSGSGKSVLLKSLIGIFDIDGGEINFDGVKMTADFYDEQAIKVKKNIGVLFQNGALFSSKNIEENVKFPLDMMTNLSEKEKKERVEYCLNCVGLKNVNKKYPDEISGGMKKRVALARAIVNIKKYLFCDEPNSGLDPQTSLMIDELIQDITKKHNLTTLVVTHNIDSILSIGEHIIFLSKSKKRWEGSQKEILNSDNEYLNLFLKASKTMNIIRDNNFGF